jgi:hypothetical protein
MKSIHEKGTRDELISRISGLQAGSKALWGKMTPCQMVKHCAKWEEMQLGRLTYKQSLLGRIFGKIALKSMMKDEPMKPNLPTVPSFVLNDEGDFETEKQRWVALIREHDQISPDGLMHPFFGRLTRDQAGKMDYKHIDHHLRQFGR